MAITPFLIDVPEEVLLDVQTRLRRTRWPKGRDSQEWEYGTQKDWLKQMTDYWLKEYDWRLQEKTLNQYPQFSCRIEGVDIRFYHIKSNAPDALPLICSHGWPDSFLRYQKIIPLLTSPSPNGEGPCFDLIIPCLPGFGFSTINDDRGINNAVTAGLWHTLMTKELDYSRFAATGGDMGSGVTRYLAHQFPGSLIGIYLTDVGIIRDIALNPDVKSLSKVEQDYQRAAQSWLAKEGAYINLQSTKPLTLAYGLSDSLAGLAAWILEKFYAWSDCSGHPAQRFSKDELITNIMIYWVNNAIGSANHCYYENTHSLPPLGKIEVPTGLGIFAKDVLPPPRQWVATHFNLQHWSILPEGGHFTAMECPLLFADDLRSFFQGLLLTNNTLAK